MDEVLPAHEWRFRGLAERVDAITAHHERRLTELPAAVRRHPGSVHLHQLERRALLTASSTYPPVYTATAT